MSNIKLARIDSRLIHGTLIADREKEIDFDKVVVANNRLARDSFEQKVMTLNIPKDVEAIFLPLDDSFKYLKKSKDSCFLIVENPKDMDTLINKGLEISSLNIGIMHCKEGKKMITNETFMDKEDIKIFKDIAAGGTEVFLQFSPFSVKKSLRNFFY